MTYSILCYPFQYLRKHSQQIPNLDPIFNHLFFQNVYENE